MTKPTVAAARQAVLGLGGNVGDVPAHFRRLLDRLPQAGITVLATSRLLRSRAMRLPDSPAQPPYCNAAVLVTSEQDATALVATCQALAATFGERSGPPGGRWQPRPLDIDVIAVEDVWVDSPACCVPHPALFVRPFVLWPLADVAADWRLPPHGRSARDYLARLARPLDGIESVQLTWCGNS